jgi:peptidoglycan/xylan/chitin deacetylase (PgdA/CDA1 family)
VTRPGRPTRPGRRRRAGVAPVLARLALGVLVLGAVPAAAASAAAGPASGKAAAAGGCPGGTVYLTLDTGNMSQAETIAGILARHGVLATFFLANERTPSGGHSLDDTWAGYWRERVREGHAFGSHTYDHVYFRAVGADGLFTVRPQFGAQAGRTLRWDAGAVCGELARVGTRFRELTGRALDPVWRAPGGKAPPEAMAAARACGWSHVHWAAAGFLGDELPSDRFPNERLLKQALAGIRAGDVLMAHLGIWSRQDPYAPMLDPLIAGLKARGLCFATMREHPSMRR